MSEDRHLPNLQVKIPHDVLKELKHAAIDEDTTMMALVAKLIVEWLNTRKAAS